jgi:hypothetical protein
MDDVADQIVWLFVLALPAAGLAWTVAHEEVSRESREWLGERSRCTESGLIRKVCFAVTCDYCLSHTWPPCYSARRLLTAAAGLARLPD